MSNPTGCRLQVRGITLLPSRRGFTYCAHTTDGRVFKLEHLRHIDVVTLHEAMARFLDACRTASWKHITADGKRIRYESMWQEGNQWGAWGQLWDRSRQAFGPTRLLHFRDFELEEEPI